MRVALCLVAVATLACDRSPPLPIAALRPVVVQDLPEALTALAGQPLAGTWQCIARAADYRCGAGPGDSLTVRIDSIVPERSDREARVVLSAAGRSASHFRRESALGFEARWTDTYGWTGTKWQRKTRMVNLIT